MSSDLSTADYSPCGLLPKQQRMVSEEWRNSVWGRTSLPPARAKPNDIYDQAAFMQTYRISNSNSKEAYLASDLSRPSAAVFERSDETTWRTPTDSENESEDKDGRTRRGSSKSSSLQDGTDSKERSSTSPVSDRSIVATVQYPTSATDGLQTQGAFTNQRTLTIKPFDHAASVNDTVNGEHTISPPRSKHRYVAVPTVTTEKGRKAGETERSAPRTSTRDLKSRKASKARSVLIDLGSEETRRQHGSFRSSRGRQA